MADEMSDREAVEEVIVPVLEERVVVGKRVIEGRTVTVTARPVSKTQTIAEPVLKERVIVERVPIGEVVDAIPQIREEGDLTVIPVVEEQIVVTKRLVLTEEIHMRRTRVEETDEQTVELFATEIDITE